MGSGGFRQVQVGSDEFRWVQTIQNSSDGVQTSSGGFRRVQNSSDGVPTSSDNFRRVQAGSVKFRQVQAVQVGSGGFRRVQTGPE